MDALQVAAVVLFAVAFPVTTVLALAWAAMERATANWARETTAMINRGEPDAVVDAHMAAPPWYARVVHLTDRRHR